MKKSSKFMVSIFILFLLSACNLEIKKIEKKAELINHYEQVALRLVKENRELAAELKLKEFEIEKLKQEKSYGSIKLGHTESSSHDENHSTASTHGDETKGRSPASIEAVKMPGDAKKDYVEFKTYRWHADDLLKIADKEFKEKNFEKAAQFYFSIINNYPHHKSITDEFYFKAGVASFETGVHHDWTLAHFEALMKNFPTSTYFRSAKLWIGLTYMKMGEKKKFYSTVEEFRRKYRNTNEWKILSSYYEKIEEKTNE